MKKILFLLFVIFCTANLSAQQNLPTDYLTKEFHQGRREAFRAMMPDSSVAAIFAFPERLFSHDVNYFYHQNPDFYYLTGYKEPNAMLLLFKEKQGGGDTAYNELFFVRDRDEETEKWTGERLGVEGAKKKLGFKQAYYGSEFKDFPIDFSNTKLTIYDMTAVDASNDKTGYDVFGLMKTFKEKAGINEPNEDELFLHRTHVSIKKYLRLEYLPNYIAFYKTMIHKDIFKNDAIIQRIMANPDSTEIENIKASVNEPMWGTDYFRKITNDLREIKTPEELVLMRKAIDLSCIGHNEVIKAVNPNMSENEAHGIHLYVHKHYGAEDEGYGPIVGAGANGCVLHYEVNNKTKINNELLLMDVGAEYHGYSADVTRTVPPTGKFSPAQKAIYNLVYEAQEEVFKICREGTPFADIEAKAEEVLAKGMIKLGIIKEASEVRNYYPHGCSHYLGLDVHDKGDYVNLKKNSIITVEPGIYIPENSPCDKKWWNIAVRIEDDVLILKDTYELLSNKSPRRWDEVEKLAAQPSKFNEMQLPVLKKGF